jgi:hypothetical protein
MTETLLEPSMLATHHDVGNLNGVSNWQLWSVPSLAHSSMHTYEQKLIDPQSQASRLPVGA